MSEHFDVVLKLTTVDRQDSPMLDFIPRDHPVRLIKELASSILSNMV